MRKFTLSVAALAVVFLAVGCSDHKRYVRADRITYEALAPAHLHYLESDADLSDTQKQIGRDFLDSWRMRLEQAEGGDDE